MRERRRISRMPLLTNPDVAPRMTRWPKPPPLRRRFSLSPLHCICATAACLRLQLVRPRRRASARSSSSSAGVPPPQAPPLTGLPLHGASGQGHALGGSAIISVILIFAACNTSFSWGIILLPSSLVLDLHLESWQPGLVIWNRWAILGYAYWYLNNQTANKRWYILLQE